MTEFIHEPARDVPVGHSCGVLVAGGGIAGIAAAIAAARGGADVLLLEREYALGGLATLGLITIYLPLCDGMGHQVVFGLGEELLKLSIKNGAEQNYPAAWLDRNVPEERREKRYMTQFNPNLFALEAEKLLLRLGVRILYGSVAVGADVRDGAIRSVTIENKSGRSAIRAGAVVDATGDADICRLAGAPVALYPKKNGLASWYYYLSQGTQRLKMFGLADVVSDDSDHSTAMNNVTVASLTNRRYNGVDGDELSQLVIDGHQKMYADVLAEKAKDPNAVPVSISSIPLVRMTRRLAGEYELDESEDHRHQDDSIGMTPDWRKRGPVFEIPYRSLYCRQIRNLLAAGRDISVTSPMWDVTRVIPPCAVTGEAAGTAAAMTCDFPALSVRELQAALERHGARLHF